MTAVEVFAPAKINLTLHITGQREDGYHLLDTLVAFAPLGDRLRVTPSDTLSLTVTGPEAGGVPTDGRNLVMQAAEVLGQGAALELEKHLPAASGMGGGSADAAALLRAMLAQAGEARKPVRFLPLGADLPMCLASAPCRAEGVGEVLTPVALPVLPCLLVNPRQPVPTGPVFRALERKDNPAMGPLPAFAGAGDLIRWLRAQRNDLQAPAIAVAPVIGAVLARLEALPGCGLARMTGSGGTCFALFEAEAEAQAAHDRMRAEAADWWMACGALGDQSDRAAPRIS